jgi:ferrous iron transport protein A
METVPLSTLKRGSIARIERIDGDDHTARRLQEMGVMEGQEVTILHEGPMGRDPIAVGLGNRTLAMRRAHAERIAVVPQR